MATGQRQLIDNDMQFSVLGENGQFVVMSGYASLLPVDTNGDKDVYLVALDAQEPPPEETEICDDGIDNDGDTLADCVDRLDCRQDPACKGSGGGGGGKNK